MNAPEEFPALPPSPDASSGFSNWPQGAITAYEMVRKAYEHGFTLCKEQCTEPFRLEMAHERLGGLRTTLVGITFNGATMDWARTCADAMVTLENDLQSAQAFAEGQ